MGYACGVLSGYSEGYMEQYNAGYEAGYDETYDRGYAAGQADGKAGTPASPWDGMSGLGAHEDFSYECGVNDGRCYGYTEGYEAGYFDTVGRSFLEDLDIASRGGVPGSVNVMFNGDMVQFPDQRPVVRDDRTMVPVRAVMESMGAQVDYEAADKTVVITLNGAMTVFTVGSNAYSVTRDGQVTKGTMDCACFNLNGRVMVPIRFLAEASGYTVVWDGHHHTAVIVDEAGLAAEIDKSFTYINSILAARLAENQGKNQETETSFSLTFTFHDENGNQIPIPLSGTAVTQTNGTAFRMKLTLDAEAAIKAIFENDLTLLDGATVSLRTALQADLTKLSATLILDEEGSLCFQAPLLLELLSGVPMKENQWICLGNLNQLGMDMDALSDGTMTVGSLVMGTMMASEDTAFYLSDALDIAVPMLEAVYGDEMAQKNGDSYTWNIDLFSILLATGLAEMTAEELGDNSLTATLTADAKGNYSLTSDWRLGAEDLAFTGSLDTSGTAAAGKLSLTLSVTDLFDLELTGESVVRIVRSLPALSLPEGAEVLEIADELPWAAQGM